VRGGFAIYLGTSAGSKIPGSLRKAISLLINLLVEELRVEGIKPE